MDQEELMLYSNKVHQIALKFYKLLKSSINETNKLYNNLSNIPETYTIINESFDGSTELENHLENYFLKVINNNSQSPRLNEVIYQLFYSAIAVFSRVVNPNLYYTQNRFKWFSIKLSDHFQNQKYSLYYFVFQKSELITKGIDDLLENSNMKDYGEIINNALIRTRNELTDSKEKLDFFDLYFRVFKNILFEMNK